MGMGSLHPHKKASAAKAIVREKVFMAVLYHKLRDAHARRRSAT